MIPSYRARAVTQNIIPNRRHLPLAAATRLGMAVVLVASISILVRSPAAGQEGDYSTNGVIDFPGEVELGECAPEAIGIDEITTCRFELVNPQDKLPEWGIHAVASVSGSPDFYGESYRRARCHLDSGWLVCPDLSPYWELGSQDVYLDLDYENPLATLEVDQVNDGVLGLIGYVSNVATAFVGHPRRIEVFRSFKLPVGEEASLVLRRDGSEDVVVVVPALGSGEDEGVAEVDFPEAGRWTVTSCRPDGEGGCTQEGFRHAYDVIDPDPIELVAGHNLIGADRIDLLFVGSGWIGERDEFVAASQLILSLDGEPVRENWDGELAAADEEAIHLEWGPFSIDPLRGNSHLFNFWYLDADVPSRAFWRSPNGIGGIDLSPLGLGPNVAVVIMSRSDAGSSISATAEHPSFLSEESVADAGSIEFGSTQLPFNFAAGRGATTFSHEIGHLLFALADEYELYDVDLPTYGFPNCAENEEQAAAWWGDLVGDLDPMYNRWVEREQAEGTWWSEEDRSADFTVGFVEGGCFSSSSDAIRPTVDGLMNGEAPVFGSVNRHRAEQILSLWSGRAVFDASIHAEQLAVSCDVRGASDNGNVVCRGTVGPYLDPPGAVALTLEGSTAACVWTDMPDGALVECPPLAIAPGTTATPVLQVADQFVELAAVTVPLPTTTTTTVAPTTTTVPEVAAPAETDSSGGSGAAWILVFTALAAAGIGGFLVWRRRLAQ